MAKLLLLLNVAAFVVTEGHQYFDDDVHFPVRPIENVPPLQCGYSVQRVSIQIADAPSWLKGTYYHAFDKVNVTTKRGKPVNALGAALSIEFDQNTAIVSFNFVKGFDYITGCELEADSLTNATTTAMKYSSSSAVTINSGCGTGNICVVSAMPEFSALSGSTLETIAAPARPGVDAALGQPQNPYPAAYGPSFFSSAHNPTDTNNETYGAAYIFEPTPGYRIYKSTPGPLSSSTSTVFPLLSVSPQKGDTTGGFPSYNHQGLMFTKSFIILPEMPIRMPKADFDWQKIYDGWLPQGNMIFNVLDKSTGLRLGRYSLPAYFSWHNVNAWENDTHVSLDIQLEKNNTALDVFTGVSQPWLWKGQLARVTMPNPKARAHTTRESAHPQQHPHGSVQESVAAITRLSSAIDISFEFGVVNPAHMWQRPTKYVWGLATDDDHKSATWFPHFVRVDTEAAVGGDVDSQVKRFTPGDDWLCSAPLFVPKDQHQDAESGEGVLIVVAVSTTTGKPSLFVVDADTMLLVANATLPVAPLQAMGLHNHWSELPTSC
eukprot:m.247545 g.247545  ORF g.247545 m.247545 type:complete len:547 (+) comp33856_c3_seq22:990-2630(+)